MVVAVEPARQGVTVGEDTVSGVVFAHDFVGVSETPEGLQKRIEKALEYTRKWRVRANVKKSAVVAVVVCTEDKMNPVTCKCERGKAGLQIADQYAYLGVHISKIMILGCTHGRVIRKGKADVGKMDAILTDSHLDTINRIK